jgi:hypothetical protein
MSTTTEPKLKVYGHLKSDKGPNVLIGIARGFKEFYEYKAEYRCVFGDEFEACWRPMSEAEYAIEHKKALSSLMSSLVSTWTF